MTTGFKMTNCPYCGKVTAHDIFTSKANYLHSLCVDCGKDVYAKANFGSFNGEATKNCSYCNKTTEHIRYISEKGYVHWWCCSCGRDISSDAPVR